jgi:glycogen debranching enzyme
MSRDYFTGKPRHLSKSVLRLAETQLLLLSSTVRNDNALLAVDLINPDLQLPSGETLLRDAPHIYRTKFLWKNACQELVEIHNYGLGPASVELLLEFAADFAERFVEGQVSLPGDAADNQALLGLEAICGLLRTKQTPRRPHFLLACQKLNNHVWSNIR